ncbi:MAG: CocE/NonD family hydrolase [Verrucomicrobiaceae bacterium]|nr:CocE/NonD family hydrolase [Verrucomicrobiaceae bacterium]
MNISLFFKSLLFLGLASITCANNIKEFMVPYEDGVKFYTVSITPSSTGKYPVVVYRTPYTSKKETIEKVKQRFEHLVKSGYAVIYQHTRGAGKSEGERYPFKDERKDGLALLDWIRKQPFYNGEIFLSGNSYTAGIHISYLETNPYDVKGAILRVMDVELYNLFYRKGFFKMGLYGNWFTKEYRKNSTIQRNKKVNKYNVFPLTDLSKKIFGHSVEMFDTPLLHPDRNSPFWDTQAGGSEYRNAIIKSKIPILLVTSFYDIFTEGILEMWRSIPQENRKNCALLITPYQHNVNRGIVKFPNGSLIEACKDYEVNWFNHIRKTEKLKFIELSKVKWYSLWQNKWITATDIKNAPNELKFYLNKNRTLDKSATTPTEITYVYYPKKPAKFRGGVAHTFGGMQEQSKPNSRPDIISFVSAPFEKNTIVEGKMKVSLSVKTDCEDTCFYVRVNIVKNNGKTYSLRDDITSVLREVKNYKPNSVAQIDFEMVEHSFMFEKGDKLRVDVSSSCVPSFTVHTNIKGNQNTQAKTKNANNTIITGKSTITLYTK